jgi:hypothetical protein
VVYMALAQYDMNHYSDPGEKLHQAIVYSKKAIELAPNWVGARNSLGNTYILLAGYESKKGLNYEGSLKDAIASLNKAHQASPNHPAPYLNLATAYADYSKYQLNHGANPEEFARNAVENAEKCLALGGESYAICSNIMGLAFVNRAKFKILQGGDPEDLLQKASQHSSKTLESGSNDAEQAYDNLLDAQRTYAGYRINKRMDPSAQLTTARTLQQNAVAQFPESSFQLWESEIEILAARWQLQKGQSPNNSLIKAEMVANRFLQQNPNDADTYAALAEIAEIKAEWLHKQNKPIEDIVSNGLSKAKKALELNPSLSETQAIAGKLHLLNSSHREAIDSLQKAIAMNRNLESKYLPLIKEIQNQ